MSHATTAGLLAGTSALALALVAAAPAQAFDKVDWTWDARILENIVKTVNIAIDMAPTGMVMVESFQANYGNIGATSEISDAANNPAAPGSVVADGAVHFQFHYGMFGAGALNDAFKSSNVLTASVSESDQAPNINGTVRGSIAVPGIAVLSSDSRSAASELGTVSSAATAVANNLFDDSDVALQLHIGQFAVGARTGGTDGALPPLTENSNLSTATALALLIYEGAFQKAKIDAKSSVAGVGNATVDSAATAVANNLSVTMAPNSLFLGDATLLAFADVAATSKVSNVTLAGFTGLGGLARPIVASLATAVGNNASISIRVPKIAVP